MLVIAGFAMIVFFLVGYFEWSKDSVAKLVYVISLDFIFSVLGSAALIRATHIRGWLGMVGILIAFILQWGFFFGVAFAGRYCRDEYSDKKSRF